MTPRRGALIVGASSGIGAALARELAIRGYAVALVARRGPDLEQLGAEIDRHASQDAAPLVQAFPHDVRDYDAAPALFERIVKDLGANTLKLVIYCAGVMPDSTDGTWTFEQERAMMETNAVGAMRWLDLAASYFRGRGRGTLLGVSSVAGDRGRRGNSAYQASKAALSTYLESLRYRLDGTGVRVVTVKPGYVATPMTAHLKLPGRLVISPERVARRVADVSERGSSVVYVPGYLGPVLWIVRQLPAWLMTHLPL
ncbi:MAG TPA: SDR family NAD(P)-dependent oxidoreductase [Ktedonobacterales bacterium]|jgi:short-subunit dehydrogenase|nr:SDR family NAD(P)-dependent oxidoreductase [Ktedonobacterales bacterium]